MPISEMYLYTENKNYSELKLNNTTLLFTNNQLCAIYYYNQDNDPQFEIEHSATGITYRNISKFLKTYTAQRTDLNVHRMPRSELIKRLNSLLNI